MTSSDERPRTILEECLQAAGFPMDPNQVVGRTYCFSHSCERSGSICHSILCGAVQSIDIYSTGGLRELIVYGSNSTLGIRKIEYFCYILDDRLWGGPGWYAKTGPCREDARFGEFELL